jgi:hypothetical protein
LANITSNTIWTSVGIAPNTSNGVTSVRLPITSGSHFYRLRKP